ncbi:hypothetical protein [Bradyrhizobium sp. MOS002]|uniref:hypothetical protein n=1 Tax=Bradyrhizobium sp. MOS002 TaxID=2133947 RepID=UPI000D129F18|nr:hypothetical protein [Bradyrhizobium sp. MOS002]PSO30531.1 hypothetical protein C7G41_21280 [Bradyrhizobium sp. MOS002]
MLTRIDANGVTETVVRKWENDRVGERIDPSKDAPVSRVQTGSLVKLSRHERRAAEAKARGNA